MQSHEYDHGETELRPKAARLENPTAGSAMRAGATGRLDVLDAQSILDLQRAVGNAGVGAMLEEERSPVHDVVASGGGSALSPEIQHEMQSRLGHDFSDVRVHTDAGASESARSVNAHAYTVGSNVVFQRDKFDPTSTAGKTMLAHELTHVVQQRSGPVDGSAGPGGIRVSDPSDRFETEASANAEAVMSKPFAITESAHTAARQDDLGLSPGPANVQRAEEEEQGAPEEDEAVQMSVQTSVQRAEEGEVEEDLE